MKKTFDKIWQKLGDNNRQRRRNAFIIFCMVLAAIVYGFHCGALRFEVIKNMMSSAIP